MKLSVNHIHNNFSSTIFKITSIYVKIALQVARKVASCIDVLRKHQLKDLRSCKKRIIGGNFLPKVFYLSKSQGSNCAVYRSLSNARCHSLTLVNF